MTRARTLVLDTHVLLWWQAGHRRLSRTARTAIDRAELILVSAIACWEVATLVASGRVRLDRPIGEWMTDMEALERIELVPLSPRAALFGYDLECAGFHGDPADRMIYATAVEHAASLVTADQRMQEFARTSAPSVRVLW